MRPSSYHILRVGLGITFLWIGVLIFSSPAGWGSLILPWAAGLLPIPLEQAMIGTAILDIVIGFLFLTDFWVLPASIIGSIHLVIVLTVTGINDFTVRDIGLLAGVLALLINVTPKAIFKSDN